MMRIVDERKANMTADPAAPAATAVAITDNPCVRCGACCAYSANWPRFSIEDDDALSLIPEALVNDRQSGMRCVGERCCALAGDIGVATSCTIYAVRPEVCRTCEAGDPECNTARRRHGLCPLPDPA